MKTKTTKSRDIVNSLLIKLRVSLICKLLLLLFITSFTASCSKDPEPQEENEENNNPNSELELIDITVQMPEEVTIDFSKTEINSYLETNEVKENDASKAYVPKNDKSFIYLSDTDGNIILMGFISKERPVLNIKSTLEASLYFGLGTVFQLSEIREKFLNKFQDLLDIEPYVKELETMYKADILLLKSDSFSTWLNDTAKKLTAQEEVINTGKSILIEDATVKSGVAVLADESDIFSVNVINFWRRRAEGEAIIKRGKEHSAMVDSNHKSFMSGHLETQTITTLSSSTSYQVDAGSNVYWVNSNSEYIPINDFNFDPNTDPNLNSQTWTKTTKTN